MNVLSSLKFKHLTISRSQLEILATVLAAGIFILGYRVTPLGMIVGSLSLVALGTILVKKLEYAVFMLVLILPFRDVHLFSIMHVKRLVIWVLFGYIIFRQYMVVSKALSKNLKQFTLWLSVFIVALVVGLVKTASELYSSFYLTRDVLSTIIFADALLVLEQFGVLYILYFALQNLKHIRQLLELMFGVSAVIALFGIQQYLVGGTPGYAALLFDPDFEYYGRATSVFSNPNGFGVFIAPLLIMACVQFFLGTVSNRKRFGFILPVMIIDSLGLFVSFSRTGMVQVLFGMLVAGFLYYAKICHRRPSWKIVLLTVMIISSLLGAVRYYEYFIRLRTGANATNPMYLALHQTRMTSDAERKYAAFTALKLFTQHPVIGLGYGTIAGKRIEEVIWVENQFLKILAEMGLFGFIPFLALLSIIYKAGMGTWKNARDNLPSSEFQVLMVILLTGFCTHIVGFLFVDFLHVMPVEGYVWVFAGAMFSLEHHRIFSEQKTSSL